MQYYLPRVRERIIRFPRRRNAILDELENLRNITQEQSEKRSIVVRIQYAIVQPSFQNKPTAYKNLFYNALSRAQSEEREAEQKKNQSVNDLSHLLATDEERERTDDMGVEWYETDFYSIESDSDPESDSDSDAEAEADVLPQGSDVVIPPVDISNDCDRDKNDFNEFISGISMDELVEGQTIRLSDGHCYNYQDIVQYYNLKIQARQPFVSPFTRELFTSDDIRMVQALARRLRMGGDRTTTRRRLHPRKKRSSRRRPRPRRS